MSMKSLIDIEGIAERLPAHMQALVQRIEQSKWPMKS